MRCEWNVKPGHFVNSPQLDDGPHKLLPRGLASILNQNSAQTLSKDSSFLKGRNIRYNPKHSGIFNSKDSKKIDD